MFTSKIWTNNSKLLQESNLSARKPSRAPHHVIQGLLWVKDLPKVHTWWLEWDSNGRPSTPNTPTEPPCPCLKLLLLLKWGVTLCFLFLNSAYVFLGGNCVYGQEVDQMKRLQDVWLEMLVSCWPVRSNGFGRMMLTTCPPSEYMDQSKMVFIFWSNDQVFDHHSFLVHIFGGFLASNPQN